MSGSHDELNLGRTGGRRQWVEACPVEVPPELAALVGGHPLVAERLMRLGIVDPAEVRAFLDPAGHVECSPFELPDLEVGVARLARAIRDGERILIRGGTDVDGQAATALLFMALRELGADVRCQVPSRNGRGQGLWREWPERLEAPTAPGMTLVVNSGMGRASCEIVEVAPRGGGEVPLAVSDPRRLAEGHRFYDLPAVGIAYELVRGLGRGRHESALLNRNRQHWDTAGWNRGESGTGSNVACSDVDCFYLDLVALGIVAASARQRDETRYLLQRGIAAMRTTARPGLRALIEVAGLAALELDEGDIARGLVPRLNAQGRLGEAWEVVELLVTRDEGRAAELASQCEGMNAHRRLEARLVEDSATSLLEKDPSLLEYAAIVLAHPEWSASRERNDGILGLVAGRLAERYQRPVVLLGEQDGLLAGAARATPGGALPEALGECVDLLVGYSGQALAAGLSLRPELLFEFRRRFSGAVRRQTAARVGLDGVAGEHPQQTEQLEPLLEIDGTISLTAITPELVADLQRLGPFGNGNPRLTLVVPDLRLVRQRSLGRRGDHLDLQVEDSTGRRQRVLWWGAGAASLLPASLLNPSEGRFSLAGHLTVWRWQGKAEVVLEAIDLFPEEVATAGETESFPGHPSLLRQQVEDYRDDPSPAVRLAAILARDPAALVWVEGDGEVTGLRRDQLRPAETLIVWTAPPGPVELAAALARVGANRLVIFNRRPEELSVETFLPRLGGLIRYVLRARRGETTLDELGGLLAQRGDAVRAGLRWFEARGQLALDIAGNGEVKLKRFAGTGTASPSRLEGLLRACLEETAAYRRAGLLID